MKEKREEKKREGGEIKKEGDGKEGKKREKRKNRKAKIDRYMWKRFICIQE